MPRLGKLEITPCGTADMVKGADEQQKAEIGIGEFGEVAPIYI